MAGIDWTYLGSVGGEGIEDFAATCLRQRYSDALQTRPASGDGGIDVFRDTPGGLIVWQIKKFTTPLTPSQKRQVKRSWKRFWDTHVAAGKTMRNYYLVTPWTPTDAHREWFDSEVTDEANFPTQWDGEAFFNGLAADFPATADRFFKGADMLENMVNAKAILATSPVEIADGISMVEALARRDKELGDIRDMVSDNYFINTGTRSALTEGELPLPAASEAGVFHRYSYLGDNRFYVESVVPKNTQAPELEPISLDITFIVEPGTDDARKIEDWQSWGIPFQDIEAETRQHGGPLEDSEAHRGYVSFVLPPDTRRYPDLQITLTSPGGVEKGSLVLTAKEVTRGISGGGLRIVAVGVSGVFQIELRLRSSLQPDSVDMRVLSPEGLNPAAVRGELGCLTAIDPDDTFTISISSGSTVAMGTGFHGGDLAEVILPLAADLADLQAHTTDTFVMPRLEDTSVRQAEHLHRLAEIYRGQAFEKTWERLVLTVKDPEVLTTGSMFSGGGALVMVEQPTFNLGNMTYTVTRSLAHSYLCPSVAPGIDITTLEVGDELELAPQGNNRLVIAAVADDTP